MRIASLLIIFLLAMPIISDSVDPNYTYQMFLSQFDKNYESQQKLHHEQIFNIKYSELLRLRSQGYDVQINERLDWNQTQLNGFLNYHPQSLNLPLSSRPLRTSSNLFASPNSFDWRNLGRVSDIKNQDNCGSCWSFAATAQYESLLAIQRNGTIFDLAEQYALECDLISNACNGGQPILALNLFNKTGIPLQTDYPYKSQSKYYTNLGKGICKENNTIKLQKNIISIQHYSTLTTEQIQQDLVDYGPLTVAIYASDTAFQLLGKSGTYACNGSSNQVNHAVLLVGYNTTHWFIKNSWGTNWGDNGYGYLSKSGDCMLKSYVDVMIVNFTSTPTPTPPSPTPTPDPTGFITLNISLLDSFGDGWSGNIIGIKQNNVMVGTFGQNFTSGSASGPVSIRIPNNIQTSVVVAQKGSYTNQIGFTIKAPNGTVLHQRNPGTAFDASTIFTQFCPYTGCPKGTTVNYYLTLTDSFGDGWNANILAFRQNGTSKNFGQSFTSGKSNGPLTITLNRMQNVDIVVAKLGSWTDQIGFVLRTTQGYVVMQRNPGTKFYANTVLGSFCADCINLSPVKEVGNQETRLTDQDTSDDKESQQEKGISSKVLNSVLIITSSVLAICVLIMGVIIVKLLKSSSSIGNITHRLQVLTTEQESRDQRSNHQINEKNKNYEE